MATTSANVAAALKPAIVVTSAKQATVHRSANAKASAATKAARGK